MSLNGDNSLPRFLKSPTERVGDQLSHRAWSSGGNAGDHAFSGTTHDRGHARSNAGREGYEDELRQNRKLFQITRVGSEGVVELQAHLFRNEVSPAVHTKSGFVPLPQEDALDVREGRAE